MASESSPSIRIVLLENFLYLFLRSSVIEITCHENERYFFIMNIFDILHLFIQWTKRKIRHHCGNSSKNIYFREREIWWAAMGQNIGFEVNGKNELFERPVLILKKYNEDMCFVIPLTTQIKNPLPYYQIPLKCGVKRSVVNITQGRTISRKRLLRKFGGVDKETYKKIIFAFKNQFEK